MVSEGGGVLLTGSSTFLYEGIINDNNEVKTMYV